MVKLSIVIATFNRGPDLIRALRSLISMEASPELWEAVIVDNNSTDETRLLFGEFADEHPGYNLRMVCETRQGLSRARNKGIVESKGELIAIIDDDQEVNREFATAYIDLFEENPDAAAAGGKIIPLYEFAVPAWLSEYTERPIAGTLDMGEVKSLFKGEKYPGGGNMAVRRNIIEKYGMFDPELGRTGSKLLAGEEKDFFNRLKKAGEKIYYTPDAVIRHIIPQTKLTKDYFIRLTGMIGRSERVRTLNISRSAYAARLLSECIKWGGTAVISTAYILSGKFSKARYLFIMRWNISKGLLGLVK